MKSEIFEDYLKIALDKGLIKIAEESKELKKYKDDVAPRAGSDDITTIEALYGVKKNDSIEYENNIMEAAHPKPVIIAPSYDKINGLVENNIERQNIIMNLVMKPTDGISNYRKYAKQALMMELVRIANDMDNRDVDSLRVLADDCIVKLQSNVKKAEDPPQKEVVSEEKPVEPEDSSGAYTHISELIGHKPSKEELDFFGSLKK